MRWHHSFYWRIAIGFVLCLALLLAVQAVLFVWVTARSGSTIPNQPPDRFAQTVAVDLSQALERDGSLDVERYLKLEYRDSQPFFVVLAGGRSIQVGGAFPESMVAAARARLETMTAGEPGRPERRPFGRGERMGPFPRGPRPEPGVRPFRPAPIVANGRLSGIVVVPLRPPFGFILIRYAPTLAVVAVVTLVVGALLATLVIFGPARRRLRAVEGAARRLGAGDLSARAPAGGKDEVSAVAAAFNAMADDLAARAEALAASDRARRQLLADVSHELTTPVTAVRGYLDTLTMPGFPLDEATRARYLGIIGDETARLERLIGDLLELARLEGGGGSFSVADVDVRQLFDRVVARHERTAAAADVTLSAAVEPGAERVRGDAGRLEQALQNLAANALRYSPAGSSVELRARRDGAGVTLTVSDSGPGIAPEHLPRVFDRFYKVEESRAARHGAGGAGGSGLGLSIVKAIAERHGAAVAVQSAPGHTTFSIAGLPAAAVDG